MLGDKGFRWESSSAIGRDFAFLRTLDPGENRFAGPIDTRMGRLYYYALGVAWDVPDKKPLRLTFMVAQTESQFEGENAVYRRTLVGMLSILGVMLIVLQLLLLREDRLQAILVRSGLLRSRRLRSWFLRARRRHRGGQHCQP